MWSAPFARLIVFAAVAGSACTVHETEIPSLIGPSEYALSIEVTATPDHIRQDGESQSAVVVRARGPNGQPVRALAIRLDMAVGSTIQDFGTLSERNVVTGNDGLARAVYTAPRTPQGFNGPGTTMSILATPYGTNSQNSVTHSVSIDLVPPGVILPPGGDPVASFVVSPTPVSVGVAARFDASASVAGANSSQLTYSWSFGDGSGASGVAVNHTFSTVGTFSVVLTVTNDRGLTDSETQTVSVVGTARPTADFVFSPTEPAPLTEVHFNAQLSTPAPGRRITQYLWNWGDGDSGTGALQEHDYLVAGNYTVVLTVVDDLGQRGTKAVEVPVGVPSDPGSQLEAEFVFSPAAPTTATPVQFNGTGSTAASGRTILLYIWDWGDGTPDEVGAIRTHTFAAAGVHTVTLTVRDSEGDEADSSQDVTVTLGP